MSIVTRFADAFNRQDVDALVDCFTEDGSYDDIFFGPHAGRAMVEIPNEPPVSDSQFRSTRKTMMLKPSVTMAR